MERSGAQITVKLFVKAKPNSKVPKVEKIDDSHFAISVKEPATEDKANRAIAKALAKYLGISAVRIRLVRGKASKQKVFEVN